MLTRSKLVAAIFLIAAFLAGTAVGSAVAAAWGTSDERDRREHTRRGSYAERLQSELSLTAPQRDSVNFILERREAHMRALWQEVSPRFDSLRASIRTEIMALLDDDQQVKYRALITHSDSMRALRRRGGSHGR